MGIDFPTALGVVAAAVLCIFAAALAYDPGGTADPAPLKDPSVKDGEMLLALYETAEMYRNGGQDAKAGEQEEMFQNKLAEVARGMLGVEISSVYAERFFLGPMDPTWNPGQVCGSAGDIPVHLAKVRDVEWYVAFMEKYSAYPIEMHLNDERPTFGFHYGFVAKSGDGSDALTYFHVDTCTSKVTDPESYLLRCFDGEIGLTINTSNRNDTTASLKQNDFCPIPISQWRQAFYVYAGNVSGESHGLRGKMQSIDNREDDIAAWHERDRLDALVDLARAVASDNFTARTHIFIYPYQGDLTDAATSKNFTDNAIQEKIQEYRDAYGALPDEFLKLLENRDDD